MRVAILAILAFVMILAVPQVLAQEISIAGPANQKNVEVFISSDGTVSVRHIVGGVGVPAQLDFIDGVVSDVKVSDFRGEDVQFGIIGGDIGVTLLPNTGEQIVEYRLVDALEIEGGLWTWDFRYLESTVFNIPDNIEMIFIDDKPILLDDKHAFRCHGCEMRLQFFEEDDLQIEEVIWEEHEFSVPIISLTKIESFEFNQAGRTISFDVNQIGEFVTIVLPFELLWEPYEVYLDDNKILFHSYIKNDTHVWINIKPTQDGTISIIGTSAIPEFSMLLPLVVGISLVVLLQYRNKITLR